MKVVFMFAAAAAALALAACDAGPPATKSSQASAGAAQTARAGAPSVDPRDVPVPLVDGKPMWAANRKHMAQENADYQFAKNGKDFGASTETDYVAKAHAFAASPPADVERLERPNGDALLYDAKSNTFMVVTKTGAPRTMFKPRSGAAYWKQQQAREQSRTPDQASSEG